MIEITAWSCMSFTGSIWTNLIDLTHLGTNLFERALSMEQCESFDAVEKFKVICLRANELLPWYCASWCWKIGRNPPLRESIILGVQFDKTCHIEAFTTSQ